MNAAKAAAAALTIAFLSASAVEAGDFSTFQPIGFSADGKVFAFEEYGVQDGSGFPYSNIFVIDTEKDVFLPGSPVRIRLDSEDAKIPQARAQSRAKASTLLDQHGLTSHPGLLAAFNPMGEIGVDPKRIRYQQYAVEPNPSGEFALELDEITLPVPEKCEEIAPESGKGFRLRFTKVDGEAADRVVYEDTRVPDSRNCPVSYQISGVMTFHPMEAEPVHVALVLLRSVGFEGNDGRWIAVPVRP